MRRDCLADALTTWRVSFPLNETAGAGVGIRAVGIWGGTSDRDRAAVVHLPMAEAIETLEAGLADRTRVRIEAFEARHPRGGRSRLTARRMYARLDAMRGEVEAVDTAASA